MVAGGVQLLACGVQAASVPPPPVEPVTEQLFGRTLTDDHRWMEDPARQAVLRDWVLAESAEARRQLADDPSRAQFAAALKDVGGALTRVPSLVMAHARLMAFQRIGPADRVPRLVLRQGAQERVLIDPNTAEGTAVVAINNTTLSPDGRQVAVHTAAGGGEVGGITVYDVASGQPVGVPMQPVWGEFPLSWIDTHRVAYTRMGLPGQQTDAMQGMQAMVRRLDGRGGDTVVLGPDTQPVAVAAKDFPMVLSSPISPWVAGLATGARADFELNVVRRSALGTGPSTPWRRVAGLDQQVRGYALRGDALFLLSSRDNPHGRVTRQRLGRGGGAGEVVVVNGSDQLIIEAIEATRDGLYLQALTDGRSRLFYSAGGAAALREIPLPFEGAIHGMQASSDGRLLALSLTGWLTNQRYYQVRQGRLQPVGLGSDTWPGAAGFSVTRLQAASRDGTQVPLVVVHPRGAAPAGGFPAMLEAYGSYGNSTATPSYRRFAMAWVQRGGAMAYCGTRGGGERGRAWHDAGRERFKPQAQDDLTACARKLRDAGLARAAGPVVVGTSAGGLLVPLAAMQHPDAFAGLVVRVGITNATRLAAAPNGANQFDEMGNPATPDGWAALAAQDAYLAAAIAADIPDTLLTIGLNDKRVAPWMSAKLAARAKQRFGASRTILLRADADSGHGVGSAEDARQAEWADIYAFAWPRASR